MASIKKSISSRQRQYVGKLYTQSRNLRWDISSYKFHGFQWKYIASFVASTFAVYFLQEVFMKALNVPFSICQIKISGNPNHSLFMYDIFNGKNSKFSALTISMLAQAAFLWCIEVSVPKISWHKYWRHLFEFNLGVK